MRQVFEYLLNGAMWTELVIIIRLILIICYQYISLLCELLGKKVHYIELPVWL